jgi:hypothetical protein
MSAKLTTWRRVVTAFFGIGSLFLVLVFLSGYTQVTVTMHEKNGRVLQPRIYYADASHRYDESRSLLAYRRDGERYRFRLPDTHVSFLRLDPAVRKNLDITVSNIEIERRRWFKVERYALPLETFRPLHDLSDVTVQNGRLHLHTTGNDPYLETAYRPLLVARATVTHLPLLIAAALIYGIAYFLFRLYRRTPELDESMRGRLVLYALFLFFLLFKGWYYKSHIRFGYPPDEGAHLSYIAYVHDHHSFFPSFESMTMLNNKKAGNYLSHPPLYYEIENLVYDETQSIKSNVENFRTMSFSMYAFAVVLLLAIGFSVSMSLLGHFVYLAVLSSVPMFAYTAGSISNDNLAFVGAAVFLTGLYRLLAGKENDTSWILIFTGGFIAYFSKLTAALLVFFALVYYMLVRIFRRRITLPGKKALIVLGIAAVPVILYQGYILTHYHALVPTFNHTHPQQYLHSPFYVPEAHRRYLSPLEWAERMWHYIEGGWFGIHSHHSFTKSNVFGFAGILLLHLFALVALFLPCKKEETAAFCRLGKYATAALLSVLLVQYGFSYKAHLASGYMGGLQPRYLLPFMVAFAIMASIFAERFKAYFWWNIAVIILGLHAVYSDFFYFLLYYR